MAKRKIDITKSTVPAAIVQPHILDKVMGGNEITFQAQVKAAIVIPNYKSIFEPDLDKPSHYDYWECALDPSENQGMSCNSLKVRKGLVKNGIKIEHIYHVYSASCYQFADDLKNTAPKIIIEG